MECGSYILRDGFEGEVNFQEVQLEVYGDRRGSQDQEREIQSMNY